MGFINKIQELERINHLHARKKSTFLLNLSEIVATAFIKQTHYQAIQINIQSG